MYLNMKTLNVLKVVKTCLKSASCIIALTRTISWIRIEKEYRSLQTDTYKKNKYWRKICMQIWLRCGKTNIKTYKRRCIRKSAIFLVIVKLLGNYAKKHPRSTCQKEILRSPNEINSSKEKNINQINTTLFPHEEK